MQVSYNGHTLDDATFDMNLFNSPIVNGCVYDFHPYKVFTIKQIFHVL